MLNSRLKSLRISAKLTQDELSKKIGVCRTTISYFESGERHPEADVLVKIADVFDCTTDYLLGRTNNPQENLKKPNFGEALAIVAEGSEIPQELLRQYIEYLHSMKNGKC